MPLSGANSLTMECVCWDKDRFGKVCGSFHWPTAAGLTRTADRITWANSRFRLKIFLRAGIPSKRYAPSLDVTSWDEPESLTWLGQSRWFTLKSSRKKASISGEIEIKFNLIDTAPEGTTTEIIAQKWAHWLSALTGTPSPTQQDEDPLSRMTEDVDLSDDDEDDESPSPGEEAAAGNHKTKKEEKKAKQKKSKSRPYELNRGRDVVGVIFLEIASITDLPPEKNGMRGPRTSAAS